MRAQSFSRLAGLATTALVVLCPWFVTPAPGQTPAAKGKSTYKAPRTREGVPDLSGTWFTNSGAAAWDIEEHPAGLGIQPGPSIIIDTPDKKIPYQPWALEKRKDLIQNHAYDDPQAHCYSSGAPRVNYAPFGMQIHHTDGAVLMTFENFHLYRYIPTRPQPHLPADIKLFMGDPRGRWEGETLVVDVTNNNGQTWFDMASNFSSDALTVVERYTRTGENEITYSATMTDPKVYTRPWTIGFTMRRSPDPNYELMELACWEGEKDLIHYPTDQGAPKR
jgi:hypothetical protein